MKKLKGTSKVKQKGSWGFKPYKVGELSKGPPTINGFQKNPPL